MWSGFQSKKLNTRREFELAGNQAEPSIYGKNKGVLLITVTAKHPVDFLTDHLNGNLFNFVKKFFCEVIRCTFLYNLC